jgi:hypothetical protein
MGKTTTLKHIFGLIIIYISACGHDFNQPVQDSNNTKSLGIEKHAEFNSEKYYYFDEDQSGTLIEEQVVTAAIDITKSNEVIIKYRKYNHPIVNDIKFKLLKIKNEKDDELLEALNKMTNSKDFNFIIQNDKGEKGELSWRTKNGETVTVYIQFGNRGIIFENS